MKSEKETRTEETEEKCPECGAELLVSSGGGITAKSCPGCCYYEEDYDL